MTTLRLTWYGARRVLANWAYTLYLALLPLDDVRRQRNEPTTEPTPEPTEPIARPTLSLVTDTAERLRCRTCGDVHVVDGDQVRLTRGQWNTHQKTLFYALRDKGTAIHDAFRESWVATVKIYGARPIGVQPEELRRSDESTS